SAHTGTIPTRRAPAATPAIRARIVYAPKVRSGARPDTKVDAVAVAIAVLAGLLVLDAAPPLERIVGVAPADAPALGLPGAAHQHSLPGDDRGAVRQVHGAQHPAGHRSVFGP